ncbi:hypothetical protein EHS13_07800 [Paenibacillus psychroresistens]|uniref:Uncharacterized protein n=1 Tax=Paenibacillus psychroresistens TaxID=1778678 RepID=A0A6B8RHC7_9BACL|nr:hypothetical protein [Paenibacillus psychroresistens]QGQ94788.1 hypothetical protein EHS13_07800 [Paenibacillus psychroresistens]
MTFITIGIAIYNSINVPHYQWMYILVAVVSGGIGVGLAVLYNHFFGKYDLRIIFLIDNVLWFVIYCIPGAILGTYLANSINENMDNSSQTIIILSTMIIVSIPLTIRKIKKKRQLATINNQED